MVADFAASCVRGRSESALPPADGVQHMVTDDGLTTIAAVGPIPGQVVSDGANSWREWRSTAQIGQLRLAVDSCS